MTYRLLKLGHVLRLTDSADVPPDMDNADWRRYQEWLALGNTPSPADPDPVPPDPSDVDQVDHNTKAILLTVARWLGKTQAQVKADFRQAWLDT